MKRLLSYLFILLLIQSILDSSQALASFDREREVREAVSAFVKTRTTGMEWNIFIRRMTISDTLKLPEGAIDYEVVAPQQWEGWGNANITVLARQRDQLVRNISVRIDVEARTDMVVTLRQIEHGATITSGDLVLQNHEISNGSNRASRKIEEIAGKKARTTLKANQPVRIDQVEKVPLIRSGQMVTIIAENEVMKVSVAGKARSSGAEGDIITVQNQNSFKELPARVLNATTVQVSF